MPALQEEPRQWTAASSARALHLEARIVGNHCGLKVFRITPVGQRCLVDSGSPEAAPPSG
eukprot:m.64018 g.64018  ORF g.64018 m.64018 type:complete len:60 (+) comp9693_c0_seq1:255-434(+)